VFCQVDGRPWNPDHVSERFKKLAAVAGVPVICLHEDGLHTGNSLMQDAGVDQEFRMREVGHADKSINDRYTHPLEHQRLAEGRRRPVGLRDRRGARTSSAATTAGEAALAFARTYRLREVQSLPWTQEITTTVSPSTCTNSL
jgi:hypothetical protein